MYPQPTISDYYRKALESLKLEVESTPDDQVLGMDTDQWVHYLVQKYAMEAIQLDDERRPELLEVETEQTLTGYDIMSGQEPGSVVRITKVRVMVPVVPSSTLFEIWTRGLAPNIFDDGRYPKYGYNHRTGTIWTEVAIETSAARGAIEEINAAVTRYNSSIESENPTFRSKVLTIANSKRNEVTAKHSKLDTLAAALNIRLTKRMDPSKTVVTAPKVKQRIAPAMPPPTKRQERPVLDRAKFEAILELLDNQCRGFERTPQSYATLTEEGLRDIILGSLNAVFEGAAVGEAFQGIGKVDIHLRIGQGEVFVAEVKFWAGETSLHETVEQLRGRLNWRDSYGVAIVLSKNVGFTNVLNTVNDTIPNVDGYKAVALQRSADNQFMARYSIPSDPGRQVEVHFLVYNLYVERPGKRQTRRT